MLYIWKIIFLGGQIIVVRRRPRRQRRHRLQRRHRRQRRYCRHPEDHVPTVVPRRQRRHRRRR